MLFHRVLVNAVAESIIQIFSERKHADRLIKRLFEENRKWGARDRRFVAETIYEIVRWWRLLWFVLDKEPSLTKNDLYEVIAAFHIIKGNEIPSWDEFNSVDKTNIFKRYKDADTIRAVKESIPDWLDEMGENSVENWDDEIHSLNQQAPVILRVNTFAVSKKSLQQLLHEEKIETTETEFAPEALILNERQNVFNSKNYKAGRFEVQDASSQQVAPFVEVEPGMRVIDACAGAGGKTMHLGVLMQNKGRIIALDIHEWKLRTLKGRARRNNLDIIETRLISSKKVIKRLKNSADRVLLDVPCSGLGVLKRNPDSKWKLTPEICQNLLELQKQILQNYSLMVKPGGRIVYSTCSIFPSENERQIERFVIAMGGQFELIDQRHISPCKHGFDGFYMAALLRKY
jgi:16S rRNA (cytosine967-C5)-methyltransferase